jgi:transcriptional regulator with XRE-family HTH domain
MSLMLEPATRFGNFIRNRRLTLGLSQQALANTLEISKNAVSLLELGKVNICKLDRLALLSLALKTDQAEIQAVLMDEVSQDLPPIGKFLLALRMQLGLSQTQLARTIKISVSYLNSLELGRVAGKPLLQKIQGIFHIEIPSELIPPRKICDPGVERSTPLASLLTNRRIELGMTQSKVASDSKLSLVYYRLIEIGSKIPSRSKLQRIAKTLNLNIDIPPELI